MSRELNTTPATNEAAANADKKGDKNGEIVKIVQVSAPDTIERVGIQKWVNSDTDTIGEVKDKAGNITYYKAGPDGGLATHKTVGDKVTVKVIKCSAIEVRMPTSIVRDVAYQKTLRQLNSGAFQGFVSGLLQTLPKGLASALVDYVRDSVQNATIEDSAIEKRALEIADGKKLEIAHIKQATRELVTLQSQNSGLAGKVGVEHMMAITQFVGNPFASTKDGRVYKPLAKSLQYLADLCNDWEAGYLRAKQARIEREAQVALNNQATDVTL